MAPTFGKRSADRISDQAQREYYIKTFKDARTDIRFLWDNPKDEFVEIKEHFDKANKMSYPCAKFEKAETCIGCDYPVEHPEWADIDEYFPGMSFSDAKEKRRKDDPGWAVRDASSKWLFPAIDPKGYVSVYKIGYGFWDSLCELYKLFGTITDKDFAIVRGGDTWNTTSYQAQAISQPYARESKVLPPTPDMISQTLGGRYIHAMEVYGYDTTGMDEPPVPTPVQAQELPFDPAPVDPSNAHSLPVTQHTTAKIPGDPASERLAAEQNKRADLKLPAPSPVVEAPEFNLKEADSSEIREWLTQHKVDFPPKAPRTVLTKLAEVKLTELADEPPF